MALMQTPVCDFGWRAPDFDLKGTDGKRHTLATARGEKATLVMFICNHCPYVKAVLDAIIRDVAELRAHGVKAIGVMPNDTVAYPDDSMEKMKDLSIAKALPFPYAIDETQDVARAYGAVCTPEFFGFNAKLELQYRGRIAESNNLVLAAGARRELFEAMKQIAETGKGPELQRPSMGCSIKWKGE